VQGGTEKGSKGWRLHEHQIRSAPFGGNKSLSGVLNLNVIAWQLNL
jgi:hypothetical protein